MAKSMRCKREKRLRAIKREMVGPIYEKKDEAKYAALEAALNAPKLPVRTRPDNETMSLDAPADIITTTITNGDMGIRDFCAQVILLVVVFARNPTRVVLGGL
ncbi:hypothetical protein Tco_1391138 [Tanacetum coccineum]